MSSTPGDWLQAQQASVLAWQARQVRSGLRKLEHPLSNPAGAAYYIELAHTLILAPTPQRFIAAIREGRLQEVERTLQDTTVSAVCGAHTAPAF